MATLIVVTGGSAGLGAALLDTAPSDAHRVDVSRSGSAPEGGSHLALDLTDTTAWDGFETSFRQLVGQQAWDRITVIHNAGVLQPIGFVGEVDADAYRRHVMLNSAATQVLGHAVLTAVRDLSCRRELVLISSGAATTARAGWAAYGAAKAAGDHWVRAVGKEQQIRGGAKVLSVAPGVVATAMQEQIRETDARDFPGAERFHQLHDEGHLQTPEAAARRLWALLEDPQVVTGTVTDLRER